MLTGCSRPHGLGGVVGDFDAASAGAERARRVEALAAFREECERVASMRLEFEQNAIRIVDFAHAGIREASRSAIPENLLSAVDRTDLRFRATAPGGGKLELRLGKFGHNVERASVRVGDANGPRGGVDKTCAIKVVLPRIPSVVATVQAASLKAAMDGALHAIARTVRRLLQRRYDEKR